MPRRASSPALLRALRDAARRGPLDRTLLVAPSFGAGRELLRRLALGGGGWVGFDVTTVRPLATRLARPRLASEGLRTMDEFDRQALMDEAVDAALGRGAERRLVELSETVGFRAGVRRALDALRIQGIAPARLRSAALLDRGKRAFLARALQRYEGLLHERRRADTATVLRVALDVLDRDGPPPAERLGVDRVLLVPGLELDGLPGRVVSRLVEGGAETLPTDAVVGAEAPDGRLWAAAEPRSPLSWLRAPDRLPPGLGPAPVELFAAASITDELREVLRRVVATGRRWDEVEIVATDPAAYGSALHALAARFEVPVTWAAGLPAARTRAGRAVEAYLSWVSGGFQAAPVRRLLEAGDLRPGRRGGGPLPAALARRFRALRIGWGRSRYRRQLEGAERALDAARPGPFSTDEGFAARRRRARRELKALRRILVPTLRETPPTPPRPGEPGPPVSPSELARGLRTFMRRVPVGTGAERAAHELLLQRIQRIEATLTRRTPFEAAVAIVRGHLDVTVRAPREVQGRPDDLGAPFGSEGGHLHLSDLRHGGYTGRPATFLVGADADRIPGPGGQDPLLTDRDRSVLGGLPTSSDRAERERFALAALLARIPGELTVSYAAWAGSEARTVPPSPLMLQAFRLKTGSPGADYEELRRALGRVVSPLPTGDRVCLDVADVWMAELGRGGILREGLDAVRDGFPSLADGLAAHEARLRGEPGPHHGVIDPQGGAFDPRRPEGRILSASRLEDLGTCPRRYLLGTVLSLRPPDDPEFDPDRWLDPLARGRVLHEVFETSLETAREQGVGAGDGRLETLALAALTRAVARARVEVPSPGDAVVAREVAALEDDVRSFVRHVRETGGGWEHFELVFGDPAGAPVPMAVPGGTLELRGKIDRVDRELHEVRVIDYKTGRFRGFDPGSGVFAGGRRLQHAVYTAAAEAVLGQRVTGVEYHFPTRRGENTTAVYRREELTPAPELLEILLDGAAAGHFVPTEQADDCRFCDHAAICRVRSDGYRTVSPLAEWSAERLNTGLAPAFRQLRGARDFEADG